jgi:MFS family permease
MQPRLVWGDAVSKISRQALLADTVLQVRSEKVLAVLVGSKEHHFTMLDAGDSAEAWRLAVQQVQHTHVDIQVASYPHAVSRSGSTTSGNKKAADGAVPFILLAFSCTVCAGVLTNTTIIVPTAQDAADGHGLSLVFSGLLISSYSIGSFFGLALFYRIGESSFRNAFLLHCVFMCLGNLLFWISARGDGSFIGIFAARFIIGLEGGCMYNAAIALITFSSEARRSSYLALYQFFVGMGLILGPVIASAAILIAQALHLAKPEILCNLVMSLWGIALFLLVWFLMPSNKGLYDLTDLPHPPTQVIQPAQPIGSATNGLFLKADMASGNFLRIFQRVLWETGAFVVFTHLFGWTISTGGFMLGLIGASQTLSQFVFSRLRPSDDRRTVVWLEAIELVGIVLMCSPAGATTHDGPTKSTVESTTSPWVHFWRALFVLGSCISYNASCLTAAPYSAILLAKVSTRPNEMMLVSQYAIFAAFLVAPIVSRGVLQVELSQNMLVVVLFVGWLCQASYFLVLLPPSPSSSFSLFLILLFLILPLPHPPDLFSRLPDFAQRPGARHVQTDPGDCDCGGADHAEHCWDLLVVDRGHWGRERV